MAARGAKLMSRHGAGYRSSSTTAGAKGLERLRACQPGAGLHVRMHPPGKVPESPNDESSEAMELAADL